MGQEGLSNTLLRCVQSKVDIHLSSSGENDTSSESLSILIERSKAKGCCTVLLLPSHCREGILFVSVSSGIQISPIGNDNESCISVFLDCWPELSLEGDMGTEGNSVQHRLLLTSSWDLTVIHGKLNC